MNILIELLNSNLEIQEKRNEVAKMLNSIMNQNTVGKVVSFIQNNGLDEKVEKLIPLLVYGNRLVLEDVLSKRVVARYSWTCRKCYSIVLGANQKY